MSAGPHRTKSHADCLHPPHSRAAYTQGWVNWEPKLPNPRGAAIEGGRGARPPMVHWSLCVQKGAVARTRDELTRTLCTQSSVRGRCGRETVLARPLEGAARRRRRRTASGCALEGCVARAHTVGPHGRHARRRRSIGLSHVVWLRPRAAPIGAPNRHRLVRWRSAPLRKSLILGCHKPWNDTAF